MRISQLYSNESLRICARLAIIQMSLIDSSNSFLFFQDFLSLLFPFFVKFCFLINVVFVCFHLKTTCILQLKFKNVNFLLKI